MVARAHGSSFEQMTTGRINQDAASPPSYAKHAESGHAEFRRDTKFARLPRNRDIAITVRILDAYNSF
jgi:hypothetical protein